MGPTYPPLPQELVVFCDQGQSLLVGTASRELVPDCVRAVGLRLWPDASTFTLLIPTATGATSIENARATGKIALTISNIPTHRTMQLKGKVLAVRPGADADHALALAYVDKFAEELAFIGQAYETSKRLGVWPNVAVDVAIETAWAQTPGPIAGAAMPSVVKLP